LPSSTRAIPAALRRSGRLEALEPGERAATFGGCLLIAAALWGGWVGYWMVARPLGRLVDGPAGLEPALTAVWLAAGGIVAWRFKRRG
jgi:hypothetical protein